MNSGHISFCHYQGSPRKRRREILGMSGTGLGATDEVFNHWRWREASGQHGASPVLPPPDIRAPSHLNNLYFLCSQRSVWQRNLWNLAFSVPFCHSILHPPPWGKQTGWEERGGGMHMTLELVELLGHSFLGGTAMAAAEFFPLESTRLMHALGV